MLRMSLFIRSDGGDCQIWVFKEVKEKREDGGENKRARSDLIRRRQNCITRQNMCLSHGEI